MSTISVIVPAYNAEKTILETIQSVQQQTFQDFELIVINDGSTDGTLAVLAQISDRRLKVFSYDNGGLATARNRGIARASGEFVSFLDADDLWTSDKLASQLNALRQNPDAGVAYSWTTNMMHDGTARSFVPGYAAHAQGNVYRELLFGNFIGSGSNILIRRELLNVIGGFDSSAPSFEDWEFYLRAAARSPFVVVPKYQILYRRHSNSMSSKVEAMEQAGLRAIDLAYQLAPPELQGLRTRSLAFHYRYCADLYLNHSSEKNGLQRTQEKLWTAIQLYPPLLRERYAQKLILKLALRRLLPSAVSGLVIQAVKKRLTLGDPRLES